jgi:hypothetical protein
MTNDADPTAMRHAAMHADPPSTAHTDIADQISTSETSQTNPNFSLSENLDSTNELSDRDTPPISAISSQSTSHGAEFQATNGRDGAASGMRDALTARACSQSQSPVPDEFMGAKRTANGEIKRASVNGLGDVLAKSDGMGHSHSASITSNASSGSMLEVGRVHALCF